MKKIGGNRILFSGFLWKQGGADSSKAELGKMYLEGRGVARDPDAARKWFGKAADAGHKGARKSLQSLEGG